eukprot:CAMPEP_0177647390 /NCGR_PEP_ID=MMETSP0447-20121125/10272_1 /TAXON_ID=0 /ORGANISM="Stygamoeba regulata, Strain BSH-02190019" /LENGTH=418 /DNA_ID=CAMNT_0019149967 /DNA_START=1246 /DNA_END=2502 /DNA_ORIENTATION=+
MPRATKGLAKHVVEELKAYETATNEKKKTRAIERLTKLLLKIRICLYGDASSVPTPEDVAAGGEELVSIIPSLVPLLVHDLESLEFEARKDAVLVFTYLAHYQLSEDGNCPLVQYVVSENPALLTHLFAEFAREGVHVHVYEMIKSLVASQQVTALLLDPAHQELFLQLFTYQTHPDFTVCTDAFDIFKDLLTRHGALACTFMSAQQVPLFERYNETLLRSENFVTRKQALELLGQLLVEQRNVEVRMAYINSRQNLYLIMQLLAEGSPAVQHSTYNIFKLFIANPSKTASIERVLFLNKEKIMKYIRNFETERDEDPTFMREKEFLLSKMEAVPDRPASSASLLTGATGAAAAAAVAAAAAKATSASAPSVALASSSSSSSSLASSSPALASRRPSNAAASTSSLASSSGASSSSSK